MLLLRVTRAFAKARVRYALVGGYAVALHGAIRGTMDIDLVIGLSESGPEAESVSAGATAAGLSISHANK